MSTNTFSGSRAIFRVQNKVVAYAAGVDVNEEFSYEPVDVLDNIATSEYVPVGYRVSFTCQIFRTVANTVSTGPISTTGPNAPTEGQLGSLKNPSIGILPRNSGTPSEILTNGYLSASITDRLTNTTLYRLQECKATSNSFSTTARGIVSQQIGFNAIRLLEEADAV
jgi:hypothetical protein